MSDVVITGAARTPMGAFQGSLSTVHASDLGAVAVRAVMQQTGMAEDAIQALLFGCVLPAGLGQAPARQVALKAGLNQSTPCTTISKVCGSGMEATLLAHDKIIAGSIDTAIVGGMENMSQAPYFLSKARDGLRLGHGEIKDHMFYDGLEDADTGALMGQIAQIMADQQGITREAMDDFAIESLQRAQTAIDKSWFSEEIAPVTVSTSRNTAIVDNDECPANARIEKIRQLKPAFEKNGSITAANSSTIADGAAALLLMTADRAANQGITPMARIVAYAEHARSPQEYPLAPITAIQNTLSLAGWKVDDVDLFEINEAFAMVTQLAIQGLNLDSEKVNVNGGACALGHPIGASGARIIVTLIYALQRLNKHRGIASICIGGGEALAIATERI